ncbi:MAG: hypothetical protein A4E48_00121 [Methanosaeta sp. PtaU1.Bin060]|nr:MAG: hypothetical protein A4E48_00121 [Methanosaeta sp. PtaU1.Bin060]
MTKGKTRTRNARANPLRCNAANARRKQRQATRVRQQQARTKGYDRQQYDKPQDEEG